MQRANRIKHIKFQPGSLTVAATGLLDAYWRTPINGQIKRLLIEPGNWAAAGSLWVKESGTAYEPQIFTFLSGTSNRSWGVSEAWDYYPTRLAAQDDIGFAGSTSISYTSFPCVCKGIVHVAGSGLGVGKSGLGLTVEYI